MRKEQPSPSVPSEDRENEQQIAPAQATVSLQSRAGKHKYRPPFLRAGAAIVAGRAMGAVSRRLHLGGGTSIVGVVAQRVYPDIIEHLATQLEYGCVVITGTNGKTTTSSFIAGILRDGGFRVWRNREGSNLTRGIAASLVIRAQPNGHLRRSGRAISVLEIDEAALPQLVSSLQPRVAVFTNLFRDQLDRYGEVDSVVGHWKKAISQMRDDATLVLNADDPTIAQLGSQFAGRVLYYGIDDPGLNLLLQDPSDTSGDERHQVIDTRACSNCGSDYIYTTRFYSHMGHSQCPSCGQQRPQPDIIATQIQVDDFDRYRVSVQTQTEQHEIIVPLPGLYNVYNAVAASTAAIALQVDWSPISSGIAQSKPMFGRGERIQVEGKTIRLLLAKNPTGFNEVLRTLFSDNNDTPRHILFVLNDRIADGQDISWIWDVDFERALGRTQSLVVTGTRALDLALRLKYAGMSLEQIHVVPPAPLRLSKAERTRRQVAKQHSQSSPGKIANPAIPIETSIANQYGLKNALDLALAQTPEGETLFIVPTYTGLLEVHKELEKRGLTPHYWEGKEA